MNLLVHEYFVLWSTFIRFIEEVNRVIAFEIYKFIAFELVKKGIYIYPASGPIWCRTMPEKHNFSCKKVNHTCGPIDLFEIWTSSVDANCRRMYSRGFVGALYQWEMLGFSKGGTPNLWSQPGYFEIGTSRTWRGSRVQSIYKNARWRGLLPL